MWTIYSKYLSKNKRNFLILFILTLVVIAYYVVFKYATTTTLSNENFSLTSGSYRFDGKVNMKMADITMPINVNGDYDKAGKTTLNFIAGEEIFTVLFDDNYFEISYRDKNIKVPIQGDILKKITQKINVKKVGYEASVSKMLVIDALVLELDLDGLITDEQLKQLFDELGVDMKVDKIKMPNVKIFFDEKNKFSKLVFDASYEKDGVDLIALDGEFNIE